MLMSTNKKPMPKMTNYEQQISWRVVVAFAHDVVAICVAWYVAYLLRFNFAVPEGFLRAFSQHLVWIMPLQALAFIFFGLYRGIWRFASIPDLKRILKAVVVASLITTVVVHFVAAYSIPRSVLVLAPVLILLFMGGSRFIYRTWKEYHLYGSTHKKGKPVLIIGAGEAALSLVKELARSEEWRVVGLLDDDRRLHKLLLLGVKVLGDIEHLPWFSQWLGVTHVIIAMPSAKPQARRQAIEIANKNGLTVLTVPAFEDLMSGKISVSQIHKVDVEDLLGREPVTLDNNGLHTLIGQNVVMVTGAGGSIGSELCRQIVKFKPSLLICFDMSEFFLYELEQSFAAAGQTVPAVYIVGDIKNERRLSTLLNRYQPTIVFHAAAYKHVPMMEKENVTEALANNVVGTYTLAKVCKVQGVKKLVLVSTDKAVNPTNVMGASKRLAEMVCQGIQEDTPNGTEFVIVRFGNVLGSSGSVIPKFREQIAQGGPITVTHPDITRYFMSIPEAAQLVMQAGLMGNKAEIFVLDMGEPVKITDLARDMIALSGLTEEDIKIEFTGLRPGEKLYEELLADDEHTITTPHPKLRIATARSADQQWVSALLKWVDSTAIMDERLIKVELKTWVNEYVGDINATKNIPFIHLVSSQNQHS